MKNLVLAAVVAFGTVGAATARGWWEVGCRVRDPATGELLAESTGWFEVH